MNGNMQPHPSGNIFKNWVIWELGALVGVGIMTQLWLLFVNKLPSLNKGYRWSSDLNNLKNKRASIPKPLVIDFDQVLTETNERSERKNNLIIYGILEPSYGFDQNRVISDKFRTMENSLFMAC